jgi:hypothetical protein
MMPMTGLPVVPGRACPGSLGPQLRAAAHSGPNMHEPHTILKGEFP